MNDQQAYIEGLREKMAERLAENDGSYWEDLPEAPSITNFSKNKYSFRNRADQILTEVFGDLEIPIDGELPSIPGAFSQDFEDGYYFALKWLKGVGCHQTVKLKDAMVEE